MKNILKPKWLLVANIIPSTILLIIFSGEYSIIKSLLTENGIFLWQIFGLAILTLLLTNTVYITHLYRNARLVSASYAAIALVLYIILLYQYGLYSRELLPFSIPQWMISDSLELYLGSFLMPSLVYFLLVLVIHFVPEEKPPAAWKSFAIAITIPVIWYIVMQVLLPLWKPFGSTYATHALLIIFISLTVLFLYFLMRGVLIIGQNKSNFLYKYQLIWKLPIALIFPLLGLALNNGDLSSLSPFGSGGVFGDFGNHWFAILAVLNGLFIVLPNLERRQYRLVLFAARSLTYSFTLYFFFVFIPYLPLSVAAIVLFGAGFLMLTPLLLFMIHTKQLIDDYHYLKPLFSNRVIFPSLVSGVLVLPIIVTLSYMHDGTVLNETLDYLYSPDYSKQYSIDKESLGKTLEIIKSHDRSRARGLASSSTPYLSAYFNWIVLDNLTLSRGKIDLIESVFFGARKKENLFNIINNDEVEISQITSTSNYDEKKQAWISLVDLEISNRSDSSRFAEYATTINLPEGVWISDYYLYVGNKKENGILSEKKAAMWVFSRIRGENRDPGILYYLSGKKVAFRVFPFARQETRKTGIEFIHKEPVQLSIDNRKIQLGNSKLHKNVEPQPSTQILYLSTKEKQSLDLLYRTPYLHFIVDSSLATDQLKDKLTKRIDDFMQKQKLGHLKTKVSFTNTYVTTHELDTSWREKFTAYSAEGGFYLDRAMKKVLLQHHKARAADYPIIIVVTDDISKAILNKDLSDYSFAFPETEHFYNLMVDGQLSVHSLLNKPLQPISIKKDAKFKHAVRAYPDSEAPSAYIANTNKPSVVLLSDTIEISSRGMDKKSWDTALLLHGHWLTQLIHPERAESAWLQLVRQSFHSGIMTPATSYIVVENESQKMILKKKQEQILSGNMALDPGDEIERMSEPGLLYLGLLAILLLWLRRATSSRANR